MEQTGRKPDSVQHGVVVRGRQQRCREDHRMEGDVVLADELIQLHVALGRLPPALPLAAVPRDADVANGRIKPHVKHFLVVTGHGDRVPHFRSRVMQRSCRPSLLFAEQRVGNKNKDAR